MKNKNVVIKIVDRHDMDGEVSTSELTTLGKLSFLPDSYSLVYTETDEELAGCTTTLRVEDGKRIFMTRSGQYVTELIIEKDTRHNCHYATPYGDFMMGVYTKSVRSDMSENGGRLDFRYTVDFNADLASVNDLSITVEAADKEGK